MSKYQIRKVDILTYIFLRDYLGLFYGKFQGNKNITILALDKSGNPLEYQDDSARTKNGVNVAFVRIDKNFLKKKKARKAAKAAKRVNRHK